MPEKSKKQNINEMEMKKKGVDNFHVPSHVSFVCFCGFSYLGFLSFSLSLSLSLCLSLNLPTENGPVDPNPHFYVAFHGQLNDTLLLLNLFGFLSSFGLLFFFLCFLINGFLLVLLAFFVLQS